MLPLQPNDRVLLLGSTFFERDNTHGHFESHLLAAHPEKNLVIRNLGWSGDNVFGESRAYFGSREDGYKHVLAHVHRLKPTLIIVNYGANESYQGSHGLDAFRKGYQRLLDDLSKVTARLVLMGLPACESLPAPMPDMDAQNQRVKMYEDAISALAGERGLPFIPLFERVRALGGGLTENGIHFHDAGYHKVAAALFGDPKGVNYPALRALVLKKGELFFHNYRPQNETYLRGFRKHEQGNNAVEIAQYEPLIDAKDREIHMVLKGAGR